ncbi:MAG TPA: DUF6600 domain-containing protein [Micropepsaceae bacterium]|nr:DUF6600 domain-containing protein [Micropepsaceae bacterium]
MALRLSTKLLATALVISPLVLVTTAPPAAAQVDFSLSVGSRNGGVSFGYFYNALAPYGRWYRHPRWGDVWHPIDVPRDFRPYYRGHWNYTGEYGWLWASDYEWGDIAFHYGRWVYDPYDGWLWVPGYVWAPSWVVWRQGPGMIGWFPMPPDDRFLAGDELYPNDWNDWNRGFGYADWYGPQYGVNFTLGFWTFVDTRHFADRDYIRYVPPRSEYRTFIDRSRNITNYTTINNVVVNRSVDVRQIERDRGQRVAVVNPRDVIKNAPITPVQAGRQVQIEERQQHGGNPRASARDRVAVIPPQNVPGNVQQTNPPNQRGGFFNQRPGQSNPAQPPNQPQGQANIPPPNQPQGGPEGRRGFFRNEPNQPPQGQANVPPPNEQFRGRGRGPETNQPPNQPPPQGQANVPPPNEQFRGRGRPEVNQPPNQPPPQGQANQGPPEQFRGRGRNEERANVPPQPQQERVNPFQPPQPPGPPSQANVDRGRPQGPPQPPPQAQQFQRGGPPPQAERGGPPQAQGAPPQNEDRNRGRGREKGKDDQNR